MGTIFTDVAAYVVVGILGALAGMGVNAVLRRESLAASRSQAEEQARQLVQGAEREADNLVKEAQLEARGLLFQARAELEKEQKDKRSELGVHEQRLLQREENLERKTGAVEKREAETQKRDLALAKREEALAAKEAACGQAIREHRQALERVAGLTVEEAKRQLLGEIESEARLEAAGVSKPIVDEAKENAEREAREIIARSIQRVTRDYVSEATISVVPIPNDAMKGRIIGREGRNIRAIEAATGIDLIIDETPEAVVISGFDPLRREVARISLERLMQDGRIHPTRIEEIVEKVKADVDKLMVDEAEKVIYEVGLSDFQPELVKVLGR
ncbi:MAG: Rnase Y domain-containing protein, partial [Nitrospirota bacterium]